MTHFRSRSGMLLTLALSLALALSLVVLPRTEAQAQVGELDKFEVILKIFATAGDITERENFPISQYPCGHTDTGTLTENSRKIMCWAKVDLGLWGGDKAYPYSDPKRKQFAGWLRKAQQYLNAHYPGSSRALTTKVENTGWGHNKFCDVSATWVSDQEDKGIGFMNWHDIDNGWAGGSCGSNRVYKPGQNMSLDGLNSKLGTWYGKAD
jgi:hypothetical protein